jgi:hypothetical protein
MKIRRGSYGAALLTGLLLTQGTLADPGAVGMSAIEDPLAAAFAAPPEAAPQPLSASQMQATEGQLWPLIGAIVSVDLALSGYFWGVYVPTVYGSSSGFCVTCYAP